MNSLTARDQACMWHPFTQSKIAPAPLAIARAQGSYLYTESGEKLFDGIASWWTNIHGHSHPHLVEAIHGQAQQLDHVIFANFTHEPAVKLAENLLKLVPNLTRAFFSDNGSTAIEVAIKMAYQFWLNKKEKRTKFIALEHGYHGDTFGAMSMSERSVFTKPFWPLLFDIIKTPSTCIGDARVDQTDFALSELRQKLEEHRGEIAAVFVEPMFQGAGGMKIFTPGFLRGIKQLCVEHNILLIADEAATGFFRTGKWFACMHEDVAPDIMCLAKGLSGGILPLAVTLATEEIYSAFLSDSVGDALLHGHSFTANPIGCAAGVASVELFLQPEYQQRINLLCERTAAETEQFVGMPRVKNARHLGTIAVVELESDRGYLSTVGKNITRYCRERGLYIRPLGNIVYLMPPYSTTPDEISWALGLIRDALLCEG